MEDCEAMRSTHSLMHIHINCSRNVSLKIANIQNVIFSLFFSSDLHHIFTGLLDFFLILSIELT